jgi:hypothetical protein
MGRLYDINGQMTDDDGEDISLKPIHQSFRVPWRLTNGPPRAPVAGHFLKAVLRLSLNCLGLFLLRFGFRLAFGHRIDARRESLFRCKVGSRTSLRSTSWYSPKVMFFSVPSNRYRQSQDFAPHGWTMRHRPLLSADLYFFSLGFRSRFP